MSEVKHIPMPYGPSGHRWSGASVAHACSRLALYVDTQGYVQVSIWDGRSTVLTDGDSITLDELLEMLVVATKGLTE